MTPICLMNNRHMQSAVRRSSSIVLTDMRTAGRVLSALVLLSLPSAVSAHGNLDEAIGAVSSALKGSPNDADLFLRRAELHRMHRDWDAAERDYAQVNRLAPGLEGAKLGLAELRLAQGREEDALQLLDEVLEKCPTHAFARSLRAALREKRGDWKLADEDLAAATEASPELHYATKRADLLERHGQAEAAARCLDEASIARGGVPLLEQQALTIEERAGRTGAALRRLDGLIAREPRPDIWLARKALLLERNGREQEAQLVWRQAAKAFEGVPPDKRGLKANRELASEIGARLSGMCEVQE